MDAQVSRPQFTTSQEAAEKKAEGKDPYFGSKVRTVEGTRQQTNVRTTPAPRPVQPAPSRLNYKPANPEPVTDNKPQVFALKEAQRKDEVKRGWLQRFQDEGGVIK